MNIIELELLSDSISATRLFYKEVLGLTDVSTSTGEVIFTVGVTRLIFRESHNVQPVYHFALDVPNNRFEEAYALFKTKTSLLPVTPETDIADFVNWDAKSFYFLDNNGNIVEIITRYPNKEISNTAFGPSSYVAVSEIGLVTGNVTALSERIQHEFSIPLYHRQPPAEKFTVCGDDEGLFVLAEKGRNWYPTTIKSHSYSTRILVYNKGTVHHIVR